MTQPRANYFGFLQKEIEHLTAIEALLDQSPLGLSLLELVKLRLSQINGCSFCVKYHTQRLRQLDESSERIDMVVVWQEAPCFSDRERAAFRWAEAVNQLAGSAGVGDDLYAATVEEFGDEGISQLTLAVAMINTWNRFAVPFHANHDFVDELLKVAPVSST